MPLSWNEIKIRALTFTQEWKDDVSEEAEAKSFWDDFFNVFGISRRRVASFEQQVKKVDAKSGYIDLLWKGVLLIEHKSRGRNLEKAYKQAKDYFPGLTEKELPRYILISDFERFKLYDLDDKQEYEFKLSALLDHVHLFGFIAGYQKRIYKEQDPVNIEAAELMGRLHDQLNAAGYSGHSLELYLVRLVFLLFADDSNIFEKGIFQDYLDLTTKDDGSDLAATLSQLFEILNTPKEKRLRNLDETLDAFPYVNGKLFEEHIPIAAFDSQMRKILLDSCLLDWGKISPAIFGSLFQSVMDATARRNLGAHYTSEKNILKLIKPLFLDELWNEYGSVKESKTRLQKFHNSLSELRFLDPACGCGNFLIIAYREIRLLEIEIIKQRLKIEGIRAEVARDAQMDIGHLVQCDVDRFYGIEYEEFPAQIAQVAMWLMDHQMNQLVSNTFGNYYVRLPLKKSATIVHGNATRIDWHDLIDPIPWEKSIQKFDYILGNPPFIGKNLMNSSQKEDMSRVFADVNGNGILDYVCAWYLMASKYMKRHNASVNDSNGLTLPRSLEHTTSKAAVVQNTRTAFVSTNSISQGEQVGVLWKELFQKYNVKIHFAHRTFSWSNEARGNAAVHVVIIGFADFDTTTKVVYEYENIKGEPHAAVVKNINPYLVEGNDNFVLSRKTPICKIPPINYGSMANDGGWLILGDEERDEIIAKYPVAHTLIRPFLGSQEFINGQTRWCLWLKGIPPDEYSNYSVILERIKKVQQYRLASTRPATRKLASAPMLFGEIRQPVTDYLLVPGVSSENRKYIPIGFLPRDVIASDLARTISNATPYLFGVLTSIMHMTWVKYVCGRLKSDFRYSNSLVYNNFPWPADVEGTKVTNVESAVQEVLDARRAFPDSSLATLYNPATMPPLLTKAHQQLDKAVDKCYRAKSFLNETKRIEFLFGLHDTYASKIEGEKS